MGNCFTLLESIYCRKFLKHTISIHPLSDQSPKYAAKSFPPLRIVVDRKTEQLEVSYEVGGEVGRGQFGVIRRCRDRFTGEELACKSIEKKKLKNGGDVEDVQREIQVLERLAGHPNIVQLKGVYEDADFVHLVMELCEGGELFDRIIDKKAFSEAEAARVMKTLMEVVQYCHAHGVIHRDIKPENILLATPQDASPIKVVDFGLAKCFKPGDKFSEMAGSAYYIAPEVLRGEYGEAIDVWSAGVVLYILLSGVPPFWDETEEGIFEAIRIGNIDLSCEPWIKISSEAKELVKGMICPDAEKRLTSQQVLNSPWILSQSCTQRDAEIFPPIDETVTLPHLPSQSSENCLPVSSSTTDQSVSARFALTSTTLERWQAFTAFVDPDLSTASLAAHLQDLALPTGDNASAALLQTSKQKFVAVHDPEQRRARWIDETDEDIRSLSSDPSILLWPPCSSSFTAVCLLQQPHSPSQSQPQQLVY